MEQLKISVGFVGDHSITGAIQELVNEKGLNPDEVSVDVDQVHPDVNLESELADARRVFAQRRYKIKLGRVPVL